MAAYSACGHLARAMQVFDEMRRRTVASWNKVLTACADNERHDLCTELFVDMVEAGSVPGQTTFVVMISAAAELVNLAFGMWVHGLPLLRERLPVFECCFTVYDSAPRAASASFLPIRAKLSAELGNRIGDWGLTSPI
jgi:pentatricopeptide repeat protein